MCAITFGGNLNLGTLVSMIDNDLVVVDDIVEMVFIDTF
jgi:hypothetical protein